MSTASPGETKHAKQVWVPRMRRYLEERGGAAPRSAVIEEGMRYVPGALAFRVGYQKRANDSKHRNFGVRTEPTLQDVTTLRRAGANKIVCNSLYYERKAGRIKRLTGPDGTPWLRLAGDADT